MKKDKKRVPINSAQEFEESPEPFFLESMIIGTDAIIHQESQGQKSFVNSTTLPTDIGHNEKTILETNGVKFGEIVEGDPMFQYVDLPEGWKKIPTNHSMWSKLVDEKGRERATIFYKAAFYDRSAHMGLSTRFNYRQDYDRRDKEGVAVAVVMDCDKVIHTTEPIPIGDRKAYEVGDEAEDLAKAWLVERYPEWKNPGACWD